MPHSSGGGSHGGGCHGGSSHSSSGSGRNSRRAGSRSFLGSTRYVYYEKSKPVYVYADYDITKKRSPLRYLILLFYVPFIFAISSMLLGAYRNPIKLKQDYNGSIVIEDKISVIEDEAKLRDSLSAFYDKTGISPAVITVYNEDWQNNYSNLENYAYDLYVNKFADEKHWLIVYSEPVQGDGSFNNWYWEGMQGDDTDPIITEKLAGSFTNNLHKLLLANSRYTVSEAIQEAFNKLTPTIMNSSMDLSALGMAVLVMTFICFHAYFMVGFNPKGKKYRTAMKCPTTVKEDICEYCNGVYVIGTCISCPHCGAPVKPHEWTVNNPEIVINEG